jgi:hypothetical protein
MNRIFPDRLLDLREATKVSYEVVANRTTNLPRIFEWLKSADTAKPPPVHSGGLYLSRGTNPHL